MPEEKYSIEDIYKVTGEDSNLRKLLDAFRDSYFPKDDRSFIQWWYTSNEGLGKSPDELCKEGKQNELENILMTVFVGPHGG